MQGGGRPTWAPRLPRGTIPLVATAVPHDPQMAVHTLENQPEDAGHLVVHKRGGPAWLEEHLTALRSWASSVTGDEVRFHDQPAARLNDTTAPTVDQLTPATPTSSGNPPPSTRDC